MTRLRPSGSTAREVKDALAQFGLPFPILDWAAAGETILGRIAGAFPHAVLRAITDQLTARSGRTNSADRAGAAPDVVGCVRSNLGLRQ
jgi:hypothetical protein